MSTPNNPSNTDNDNPLAAGVPALQPPKPTQTMLSPDGTSGEIPVEHVQDAVANGFKMGFEMTAPDGTPGIIPVDKAHDAVSAGFKPKGSAVTGAAMKTSTVPNLVRGATATLPVVGAATGGALASPGVATTPLGVGLGAAAGESARLGVNRAIFGNQEQILQAKQYIVADLKKFKENSERKDKTKECFSGRDQL